METHLLMHNCNKWIGMHMYISHTTTAGRYQVAITLPHHTPHSSPYHSSQYILEYYSNMQRSSIIIHPSPLTMSPLTPHPSPCHPSPIAHPHPSLLTPHSSPLTPHSSLLPPPPDPRLPYHQGLACWQEDSRWVRGL